MSYLLVDNWLVIFSACLPFLMIIEQELLPQLLLQYEIRNWSQMTNTMVVCVCDEDDGESTHSFSLFISPSGESYLGHRSKLIQGIKWPGSRDLPHKCTPSLFRSTHVSPYWEFRVTSRDVNFPSQPEVISYHLYFFFFTIFTICSHTFDLTCNCIL